MKKSLQKILPVATPTEDYRIPQSTEDILVFPLDKSNDLYDIKFYTSNLTDGRVTFMEIHQVLTAVNTIRQAYTKRMRRRIGLILAYELVCILFYCLHRSKNSEFLLQYVLSYIVFALSGVVAFAFFQTKNARLLKHTVAELLHTEYRFFAFRGLRWNIPDSFPRWLELHKDYRFRLDGQHSLSLSKKIWRDISILCSEYR